LRGWKSWVSKDLASQCSFVGNLDEKSEKAASD